MPSVLQMESFLVNLKHERELKCQTGKTSGQMVSCPSQPVVSKTKETSVMGKPGFHLVWSLALFILDSCLGCGCRGNQQLKIRHLVYNKNQTNKQKTTQGTSLVFQWLQLQTPSAGGLGSVPGWGTRSHIPQLRPRAGKQNKTTQALRVQPSL